jgi:hypothetical protein
LLLIPLVVIVVGMERGLGGGRVGKPYFQHLRHVLLVPLAGPLKHGKAASSTEAGWKWAARSIVQQGTVVVTYL